MKFSEKDCEQLYIQTNNEVTEHVLQNELSFNDEHTISHIFERVAKDLIHKRLCILSEEFKSCEEAEQKANIDINYKGVQKAMVKMISQS